MSLSSHTTSRYSWTSLLLLSFLLSGAVGTSAALSGGLEAKLDYDVRGFAWTLERGLTFSEEEDGWEIVIETEVEDFVWERLEIEAAVESEDRGVGATVRWDPAQCAFSRLSLDAWLETGCFALDAGFDLYATRCWTDLGIECEVGGGEIDVGVRFGASKSFCFDFYRADAGLSFETCGMEVDIDGRVSAKKGFERIDVEAVIPLPEALSWLTMEAEARWTLDAESLAFEPNFAAETAWEDGFLSLEVFGDVLFSVPMTVRGPAIAGLCVEGKWDDFWFEVATSFDPARNGTVTGKKAYGRIVGVGADVRGPCDVEASIEFTRYTVDPAWLAACDQTVFSASIQLTHGWSFDIAASFDIAGLLEVALGLDVAW